MDEPAASERRATAARLYNALAQQGDTKVAWALAGVSTRAMVQSFVEVFSDTFAMEKGKKGGEAHVTLVEG